LQSFAETLQPFSRIEALFAFGYPAADGGAAIAVL